MKIKRSIRPRNFAQATKVLPPRPLSDSNGAKLVVWSDDHDDGATLCTQAFVPAGVLVISEEIVDAPSVCLQLAASVPRAFFVIVKVFACAARALVER